MSRLCAVYSDNASINSNKHKNNHPWALTMQWWDPNLKEITNPYLNTKGEGASSMKHDNRDNGKQNWQSGGNHAGNKWTQKSGGESGGALDEKIGALEATIMELREDVERRSLW